MKKVNKFLNSVIGFLLISLTIILFISPKSVLAEVTKSEEDDKPKYFCYLCEYRDKDDPLYEKERQFYQKIHMIKTIFGNSIDEVALASAVLHRYSSPDVAYETEYSENFDTNAYNSTLRSVKDSKSASLSSDNENWQSARNSNPNTALFLTADEAARVKENEKIDLITAAAIIMIDSNHLGTYSDICFRDGLAGNKLIGNTVESDSGMNTFMEFMNGAFCGSYQIYNLWTINPITFLTGAFSGDSFSVTSISAKNRLVNTSRICNNGYIGGLYEGVDQFQDDEQRHNVKIHYANQIIEQSNYYKKLYGKYDGSAMCTSSIDAIGDYTSWKQADSKWGDILLGSGSGTSLRNIGCTTTSVAIQMARSGTQINSSYLSELGYSSFNPGALAKAKVANKGYTDGGAYYWNAGISQLAPNWNDGYAVNVNTSSMSVLASKIEEELKNPAEGKYQKYIILHISADGHPQHWVAVDRVENGVVKTIDPGSGKHDVLTEDYTGLNYVEYRVMWDKGNATGSTTSSTSSSSSGCLGGDEFEGILSWLRYIESSGDPATCNYKGKGEGTGYIAKDEHDGPKWTSAWGLTNYDADDAVKMGYPEYMQDGDNGCIDKEKADQLYGFGLKESYISQVEDYSQQKNVQLKPNQLYALGVVAYGGSGLMEPIVDAIAEYGADSEQVWQAFKNSYHPPQTAARYGLGLRRIGEYEIFMTGNYNAAKQYDAFHGNNADDSSIQNASMADVRAHFGSTREEALWDGTSSSSSAENPNLGLDGRECKEGRAVGGGANVNAGNINYTTEDLEECMSISKGATIANSVSEFESKLANTQYKNLAGFNNLIKANVDKAGRGTVAGAVTAAMTLACEYPKITKEANNGTAYKLFYYCKDQKARVCESLNHGVDGIEEGVKLDCSAFTVWSIYNGGYKWHTWRGSSMWNYIDDNNYWIDVEKGQVGDILWTPRAHWALIVGKYDDGFYTAEEWGYESGLVINKRDFSSLRASEYVVMDLNNHYYNDSSNIRTG